MHALQLIRSRRGNVMLFVLGSVALTTMMFAGIFRLTNTVFKVNETYRRKVNFSDFIEDLRVRVYGPQDCHLYFGGRPFNELWPLDTDQPNYSFGSPLQSFLEMPGPLARDWSAQGIKIQDVLIQRKSGRIRWIELDNPAPNQFGKYRARVELRPANISWNNETRQSYLDLYVKVNEATNTIVSCHGVASAGEVCETALGGGYDPFAAVVSNRCHPPSDKCWTDPGGIRTGAGACTFPYLRYNIGNQVSTRYMCQWCNSRF